MASFWQDLRYAFRAFGKSPWFASLAWGSKNHDLFVPKRDERIYTHRAVRRKITSKESHTRKQNGHA